MLYLIVLYPVRGMIDDAVMLEIMWSFQSVILHELMNLKLSNFDQVS